LRRNLAGQNEHPEPLDSTVEGSSSGSNSSEDEIPIQNSRGRVVTGVVENQLKDPLIFPGLYAPSGFDMMGILIRVRMRPNPKIDIGNVDSSVALVVCDTDVPGLPIVYYSEPFSVLTGYSPSEIMGKNCRFLQVPCQETHSHVSSYQPDQMKIGDEMNRQARVELRTRFERGEEARVKLINYTKGGKRFVNILTTIPITWEGEGNGTVGGKRYIVGFQADEQGQFGM